MTTAQNDLTNSSRVESNGKDPTVGRTNSLLAKSLFQYRNGRMWVTTRPHHPKFTKNILDKLLQGYIRAAKDIHNVDMLFLATDKDLLWQVAAVHHLKIVQERTLVQWVPSDLLVVCI